MREEDAMLCNEFNMVSHGHDVSYVTDVNPDEFLSHMDEEKGLHTFLKEALA